jgi:hypothetical protein
VRADQGHEGDQNPHIAATRSHLFLVGMLNVQRSTRTYRPDSDFQPSRALPNKRGHLDIGISGVWCPVSGFRILRKHYFFFLCTSLATR